MVFLIPLRQTHHWLRTKRAIQQTILWTFESELFSICMLFEFLEYELSRLVVYVDMGNCGWMSDGEPANQGIKERGRENF